MGLLHSVLPFVVAMHVKVFQRHNPIFIYVLLSVKLSNLPDHLPLALRQLTLLSLTCPNRFRVDVCHCLPISFASCAFAEVTVLHTECQLLLPPTPIITRLSTFAGGLWFCSNLAWKDEIVHVALDFPPCSEYLPELEYAMKFPQLISVCLRFD